VTGDDQPDFLQGLSARTRACLMNEGLTSIESLALKSVRELLPLPNFNRRALRKVTALLAGFGRVRPVNRSGPIPFLASPRSSVEDADCRRLRTLHATLRPQQCRREAICKEFEGHPARADERIQRTQRAGAALANEFAVAIGQLGRCRRAPRPGVVA
jgi:hypothetical protein